MNIGEIYEPIFQELSKVETEIKKIMRGFNALPPPVLRPYGNSVTAQELIGYFLKTPGKRFRPALVLLSAKAAGCQQPVIDRQEILLAAAVELIHSASLIHDDVIDDSGIRRSQTTLNKRFGNRAAVIAGDMLYAEAFSLLVKIGRDDILDIMCRTTQEMCTGEISGQQLMETEQQVSLREYLKMIEEKTASFMSACCRCGSLLSLPDKEPSGRSINALANYGLNLGMVYQIVDDYTDGDFINTAGLAHADIKKFALESRRSLEVLDGSVYKEKLADLVDYIVSNSSELFYSEVTGGPDRKKGINV